MRELTPANHNYDLFMRNTRRKSNKSNLLFKNKQYLSLVVCFSGSFSTYSFVTKQSFVLFSFHTTEVLHNQTSPLILLMMTTSVVEVYKDFVCELGCFYASYMIVVVCEENEEENSDTFQLKKLLKTRRDFKQTLLLL